jgi:hypothetical protein
MAGMDMKRDFSLTHCRSLWNYDIDKTLGIELDIQHGLLLLSHAEFRSNFMPHFMNNTKMQKKNETFPL